jgi:hypothetical protein
LTKNMIIPTGFNHLCISSDSLIILEAFFTIYRSLIE